MKPTPAFLVLGLAFAPGLLAHTLPTTVVPLRPSELAKAAEQIVVGTVTSTRCRMAQDGFGIQTLVTLENLLVHKGTLPLPVLTLELAGGQIGDRKQVVHDMPALQVGKRYLLYVEGNGKFVSPIVGFWQGAFEVRTEGGRETLVNLKGETLVGIRDDRFVFLKNGTNAPALVTPVAADTGRRAPAHRDATALEAARREETLRTQPRPQPVPELPALPASQGAPVTAPVEVPLPAAPKPIAPGEQKAKDGSPIYLASKDDAGERLALAALLAVTR